jgi:hypothetical protein
VSSNIEFGNGAVFLTISTFAFATYTGFFISRQGRRYSQIRKLLATFDGILSSMYRDAEHISIAMKNGIKKIVIKHYTAVKKKKQWDYHLKNKSTTLTDINLLLEKQIGAKSLKSLKNFSLRNIMSGLQDLQVLRKQMIALELEKVPAFYWGILGILAGVLLAALSFIPSQGLLLYSALKVAFAIAIILVVYLLYKLNGLRFFEKTIGQKSAQDILEIFDNKK